MVVTAEEPIVAVAAVCAEAKGCELEGCESEDCNKQDFHGDHPSFSCEPNGVRRYFSWSDCYFGLSP